MLIFALLLARRQRSFTCVESQLPTSPGGYEVRSGSNATGSSRLQVRLWPLCPESGRKFGAPLTYTDCGLRGHFLADWLLLAGPARNRRPRLEADLGVAAISVLPEILELIGRHLGVSNRVHDIFVAHVMLEGSGVMRRARAIYLAFVSDCLDRHHRRWWVVPELSPTSPSCSRYRCLLRRMDTVSSASRSPPAVCSKVPPAGALWASLSSRRGASVRRDSIPTKRQKIYSPTNHRCPSRERLAVAAVQIQTRPAARAQATLSCPETVPGKPCSFRRRVRCRLGRLARCF